jgi:hypothetical protein
MTTVWSKLRARGIKPMVLLGYMVIVAMFVGAFAQFYIPEKGFSYLVSFGGRLPHPRIDALKNLDYYVEADSDGYDAQYYVQIAMAPSLRDPQLKAAVDSLPYRARRILISWVSYVMGLGQPAAILNAYVLQNAISWLLLAGVLLWWFPPLSWNNWLRWTGVLFSFGMCFSLRNSLVDGPSLLLIAAGIMLLEKGKPWWSAVVLALGGLGKETNLLGAAGLLRKEDVVSPRRWPALILRGLLVALPLALWLVYIQRTVGPMADAGVRNFDWPFMGFARKWIRVWMEFKNITIWSRAVFIEGAFWSFLMMVAVSTQFIFLMLRPTGKLAWWRVGIAFAVLLIVLGDAVWEGYPGAASRVLLPMQLAFNVLVPSGRKWLPVLLLGNLTLVNAPVALQPPPDDSFRLAGAENLIVSPEGGRLRVLFSPAWYGSEHLGDSYWSWSRGSSTMTILNPHAFALEADWDFELSALRKREVTISGSESHELWRGEIQNGPTNIKLSRIVLQPGQNSFAFDTDAVASRIDGDSRLFSFCLKNWTINLRPASFAGAVVIGPFELLGTPESPRIMVNFSRGWYDAERYENIYWRWSKGPAEVVITNRNDTPIKGNFSFSLNAISKRTASLLRGDGTSLWEGEVSSRHSEEADLRDVVLSPGDTRFIFQSNLPASGADNDTRLLDLIMKNLVIEVAP